MTDRNDSIRIQDDLKYLFEVQIQRITWRRLETEKLIQRQEK